MFAAAIYCSNIGQAANITWTGAAGDNNVLNSLNWSPVRVPVAGDTVIFAGSTGLAPQLGTGTTISAITFSSTAQAFTLGGAGTYTINSGVTNSSASTETINNAIKLGASQSWAATSGNLVVNGAVNLQTFTLTSSSAMTLTINGAISGTGGVTKTSTGTLVLSGNNTFSGTTSLSKGTLTIGSDTALGTGLLVIGSGNSTTTLATTGGSHTIANTVQISRNFNFTSTSDLTMNGAVTLAASRTITVASTGALTLNGVVGGSGRTLTKLGTGTLVLNGANTFTGGTVLSAGVLTVGNNAAAGTGTLSLGTATIQAGVSGITIGNAVSFTGDITFGGTQNLSFSGTGTLAAARTLTVTNPNTTFSGIISGSGTLSKAGTGTLTLGGANTFSGGAAIKNGTLVLDANAAAGTGTITVGDTLTTVSTPATLLFATTAGRTATNAISVSTGSTGLRTIGGLNTTGVNTFSGAVALGTGVTLTEDAGGEVNFSGIVSGAGGITKTGAGTIRLSNTNTFTGATLISAGTLAYGASNALGTGTVTVNGGILDMGASRTDSVGAVTLVDGSILGTGTSTLTSISGFTVQNGTVSAILAGAVNLTKDTAGTVVLAGANTFSGTTNVNAGTLSYGASNVLGTGALIVNGGILDMGPGRTDSVGAVTLAGGSILGGAGSILTSTSGFTLQSGTVTNALGGAVAVVKNTAGTVLISGANTYTGTTTVSAGTLRLDATETLPNGTATTISSGATLDMNNLSDTVGSLAGAGNLLLGSGTLTSGGDNTSTAFTGTIGGSGGITKTGTGTFTLGGLNSYSGATNVNTGTLALGSAGAGPAASRVTIASGATFNVAGFTAGIGSLAGAGSVTLGAGTLTAGADNTSSTFSGTVSGTGSFTKAGTSTLTMTGANTFSGTLSVNSGSVVLSGTTGAAASVSAVSILTGASLVLDNSAGENSNRITNTAAINIQGGELKLISDSNGTNETVGQLSSLLGNSNITVVHNGTATQSSALTFSSIGTVVTGTSVNFSGTGGTLGSGLYGPHIYITGQANGLIGGWARVGTDFAEYQADGVHAYSSYYTGSAGINVNDSTKIVQPSSTSPVGAYTLTNAGTTTDGDFLVSDLALVDLNTSATRTLNLLDGGLTKKSAPDTTISGAGRLTAGGTAAGGLSVAVETGRILTIASSIIDNAGTDGIYGNAGDGVVSVIKSDAGTLVLSGTNTFTGGLYLNEGTTAVAADANLGAGTGSVFLSGGTLSVTSGFTASVGRRFVLTAGLTGTIDIAASQSLILTGANDRLATASTSSRLVKTGAGDLVLGGANPNFTGTVQISAGAVELRIAGSLGTGSIDLSGGTLRLRADASTAFGNPLSLVTDSTIAASTLTAGTPVLSLGTVNIGAQTLSLAASGGATLSLAGGILSGNATFNATAGTTTIGAISGAFGFVKTGAGILQLTAPGTYTGITDIQGGILRLANATGITLASNVNIGALGTVDLNSLSASLGSIAGTGSLTLGSGTLTVGGNGLASSFGGVISGAGGLTKASGETLTLSGTNTYGGATSILAGELLLGADNSLPAATAVTLAASANLNLASHSLSIGSLAGAGTVGLGAGALTVGDASSTTFSGGFTGAGSVMKTGTGTLSLSGTSTFTGPLTVFAGTLALLSDTALGGAGGATSVTTGAQIVLSSGIVIADEPLSIAGTGSAGAGALRLDSGTAKWAGPLALSADASTGAAAGTTLTLSGSITLSGRMLTFGGAGDTDVSGTIIGTGTLKKSGTGTLILDAANTFTGPTIVAGGTLRITEDAALGAVGAGNQTEVLDGATIAFGNPIGSNIHGETLLLAGNGVTGTGSIQNQSGDNIAEGAITLTANASVNVAAGTSLSLVGGIGESALGTSLAKNGAGTLVLGGTNTFTGTLAVNDGTLQIAADNTLNGRPGVSLAATATLDLNDFSDSLGSISGAGTVTFGTSLTGGGTLSVGANGASTTFTGTITGVGDFEKTGTGSLTLTAANTYVGNTTVSDGTLVAGNNLAFGASTQTITLDGGGLASNNDTRSLAYGITVGTSGGQITGANSITLTGAVTSGGAGSVLELNLAAPAKTVTINPSTAGTFDPGMIRLTSGTLLLGSSNRIGDTTDLAMNGGTLKTGGFSDTLGTMTLTADSVLDFGTSNNVRLQFSSASWTGGTLTITNWTGAALTANNADQLLVGTGSVNVDFLNHLSFQGFAPGAILFNRGGGLYEIVPVPEPATIFGATALLAFVGWRERHRLRRMLSKV